MLEWKKSRPVGFAIVLVIYLAAALISISSFLMLTGHSLLWRIFIADVIATLFVWSMGMLIQNASVYDPYWSIAPLVVVPLVAGWSASWSIGTCLLITVILFWAIRLTTNWAQSFHNLATQDWRYTELKQGQPHLWFVTNLFGIHLLPTMIVFMVMVPAVQFVVQAKPLVPGTVLSASLCVAAVLLQLVSDAQMRYFRSDHETAGKVMDRGLWRYSRHPNYLGEILMWWGIYLMAATSGVSAWFSIVGPIANTLLFLIVSIPLMERRLLQNKSGYAAYQTRTGKLLPKLF